MYAKAVIGMDYSKLLPESLTNAERTYINTWVGANCTVAFPKSNLIKMTYENLSAEIVRYRNFDNPEHPVILFTTVKTRKLSPLSFNDIPADGNKLLRFIRIFHQIMMHYDEIETLNSNISKMFG